MKHGRLADIILEVLSLTPAASGYMTIQVLMREVNRRWDKYKLTPERLGAELEKLCDIKYG
jgi:hypothetical protein